MLFLFLIIICAFFVFLFTRTKKNYWKNKNVVEETNTMYQFLFGDVSISEVYKEIYDKHTKEMNVGIYQGLKPTLLVRDLENVQAVLASDFQSFYSRGIQINPHDTLGDNVLFIEDYARWKILRHKISPAFTTMKLKNMFQIIERCSRDFVEIVEDLAATNSSFDILRTYTAAAIAASIFGIDTKIGNAMNSPFLQMSKSASDTTFKSKMVFFIGNTFPKLFNVIDIQLFNEYEEFFIGAISKVLKSRSNENVKRHDFIDICVELQKQGTMKDPNTGLEIEPTDEVLAAQAFFFFIAGTDTTATTMHFTLLELSMNPDILRKVHKEIDEVFRDCGDSFTYNHLEKLTYLEMVINESMRKYPPIGFIPRKCTNDTTLPNGNVKLNKNDLVVVPIYAIQRDEQYYPDPEKFDPERFSPQNIDRIPKFAFLPFGEGSRACIGMRLGRLQQKAGLGWLLRRYTLKQQPPIKFRFERSPFAIRDPNAQFELVKRNVKLKQTL